MNTNEVKKFVGISDKVCAIQYLLLLERLSTGYRVISAWQIVKIFDKLCTCCLWLNALHPIEISLNSLIESRLKPLWKKILLIKMSPFLQSPVSQITGITDETLQMSLNKRWTKWRRIFYKNHLHEPCWLKFVRNIFAFRIRNKTIKNRMNEANILCQTGCWTKIQMVFQLEVSIAILHLSKML